MTANLTEPDEIKRPVLLTGIGKQTFNLLNTGSIPVPGTT